MTAAIEAKETFEKPIYESAPGFYRLCRKVTRLKSYSRLYYGTITVLSLTFGGLISHSLNESASVNEKQEQRNHNLDLAIECGEALVVCAMAVGAGYMTAGLGSEKLGDWLYTERNRRRELRNQ